MQWYLVFIVNVGAPAHDAVFCYGAGLGYGSLKYIYIEGYIYISVQQIIECNHNK